MDDNGEIRSDIKVPEGQVGENILKQKEGEIMVTILVRKCLIPILFDTSLIPGLCPQTRLWCSVLNSIKTTIYTWAPGLRFG